MAKKIERGNMTQTDSKGKVLREPRDNAMGEAINFHWWKKDIPNRALAIASTVSFIQRHQGARMEQLTTSTRLYGNSSVYNLTGAAFTRASSINTNPSSQRISYNICASVVDTLVSKIAKNKVIPLFITNGGKWDIQKQAKDLTKFAQGLCYQENVHKKVVDSFRDAGVWGDGLLHIFAKNDRVCIERALPHEFAVDMVESLTGPPQQLHRVKIMDRDIALWMFPELEANILSVSPANYQEIGGQGTAADLITVTESWHLPSGPDTDDGLHVISIGDGDLSEPYTKDYFPFARLPYCKRVMGWWGQGAVERLEKIQGEISRSMILKQRSLWMMSSFKVLLENGSKVVSQHLNNDVGAILHYTGTPPQYVTPPATNPELQQWIDWLIAHGNAQEGVSEMSTAGEVPMGVESGKAMRTLVQISDDRFLSIQQDVEDFTLEIIRQAIEVVKDIYAEKETYEVTFPDTQFVETIDWKDVQLEKEQYVLKAYPTSSLSEDVAGRLSEVQELAQAGMISPRSARRLMGMPDLEMNENLSNAAEDLLHKILEQMLDEGKYRAPEPFFDLQLAKQLVNEYYNYADYMNAPDNRLNLLRQFNSQLNDLMGVNQPQPQNPQGGAPLANPMPTPQSNLIPNTAQPGVVQ